MINDVRRVYFYAKIQRGVYIEVPREDPRAGPNVLGKLKLCLYGTRDAAQNWEAEYVELLQAAGFTKGMASACVFHHGEKHDTCSPWGRLYHIGPC